MKEIDFSPKLVFLSDLDKGRIFEGMLQLLEETGMAFHHEEAAGILLEAGCTRESDGLIRIPRNLVQRALASAPKSVKIYNRLGEPAMDLGGRRSYFGTGSDLMFAYDAQTRERTLSNLETVKKAARTADALPNLDFIMSYGHPQELPPQRGYLESFRAMCRNSVKPIVCTAKGRADLAVMWDISVLFRENEEDLRQRPYLIHYAEPVSPLKHPVDSLDKLLFCAEKGLPLVYSPAPIAGSTSPITIAGHVVQGLSECFAGLVLHQLVNEGAPFIMGMGPAVLDMATGQCSYNAPEYLMSYLAAVEMSHFFDLPNWGYAGTSDSQLPDGQAAFEAGLECFLAAAVGSNLNHDVGYIDFGLTGSLDMMVFLNEVIDQVRRMMRGAPTRESDLALRIIEEGYREGHFLGHPHTQENFRSIQWRPKIICRHGHEVWSADGGKDLLQRAGERLAWILENHRPEPLPEDVSGRIDALTEAFEG